MDLKFLKMAKETERSLVDDQVVAADAETKSPWKTTEPPADTVDPSVMGADSWPALADAQQPRPRDPPPPPEAAKRITASTPTAAQAVTGVPRSQAGGNTNPTHRNPSGHHPKPVYRRSQNAQPPYLVHPVHYIQPGMPPAIPSMVLPPHVPVPDYSYAPYSPYPIAGVPFEKSGNEKKRQASPLPPVLPVPHGDLRQPWLHQSAFDPRNMPPIPGPRNFARPPYMGPGFPGSAYYMPVPPPPGALRGPYHPHFASYPLNRGPPVSPPAHIDLGGRIIRQIEFYFSDENLPTDYYLISLMDKHGWVPITKVADFRRIKAMTTEIPFILYALQFSSLIEVQGDKIRRRDQWSKWVPASKRQNPEEKIGNNGEEDPSKHDSCRDLSVKPSEDSSLEGAESSAISPDGSENLESSLDKERKPDDLASDFSNKFTL